jgi:hypothetical protein
MPFLTITKIHLLIEHTYTLNSSLLTYASRRVFQNLKFKKNSQEISNFQNSKNGMHQVGPKVNFLENFSSLALIGEAAGVAQISISPWRRRHVTDGKIFLL